jgi:hypothetical protein
MKAKFCHIYGVPAKDVKYVLDGEVLDDAETCESLDIEDETMIDVKVSDFSHIQILHTAAD